MKSNGLDIYVLISVCIFQYFPPVLIDFEIFNEHGRVVEKAGAHYDLNNWACCVACLFKIYIRLIQRTVLLHIVNLIQLNYLETFSKSKYVCARYN